MDIRMAAQKDIDSIRVLYEHFFVFNANQQPQYYREALESGKYPASVIENSHEDIFIAVEEHAVIGLIHVLEDKTPPYGVYIPYRFGVIVDLFVEPPFRGTGVGALLTDAAKQWAKKRELAYLELFVLAENENGIRFYDHIGFKTVSHTMRLTL